MTIRLLGILAIAFYCVLYTNPLAANSLSNEMQAGLEAEKDGAYLDAAEIWQKLAQKGDPGAQFRLARLMADGLGLPQNKSYARMLFEQALEGEAKRRSHGYGPHPLIGGNPQKTLQSPPAPQNRNQRASTPNYQQKQNRFTAPSQSLSGPTPRSSVRQKNTGYGVQLGFYASKEQAQQAWQTISARFSPHLGHLSPTTEAVTLSGRSMIKLIATGLNQNNASQTCQHLIAQGQNCVARRL